jgi:hypothetical protein
VTAVTSNTVYEPSLLAGQKTTLRIQIFGGEVITGIIHSYDRIQVGIAVNKDTPIVWLSWIDIASIEIEQVTITHEPITIALGGITR